MFQWQSDESIIVVKVFAEEDVVTYLRVKRMPRDKEFKGEGMNM